jgi:flagellar hook-associated protein 2
VGTISVGGLASGLDTNSIIAQLVTLERRSVDLLVVQRGAAQDEEGALQTFNAKVLAFLGAVDKLRTPGDVLARKATSSDPAVLTATAGSGAAAGSTTVTVTNLAKGSIATAANGKSGGDATVATGSGSFAFRVGSGAVQTVALDTTTTLQGLATAINDLNAGATASVVNVGTAASPDYRLHIASNATGTSSALTVVTDGTTLGVSVTQAAENATLTVGGFAGSITRESNTFADVIPGVTFSLAATGGPVTVTVATDADGIAANVQAVVTAFNDLVSFVAAQSTVTQDATSADREVKVGPLALDGTVRSILETLHRSVADAVPGLTGSYTLLAQVGVTTNRDGTLAFDGAKLTAALASDDVAVGALFAGSGAVAGVADRVHDYLAGVTQAGGLIAARTDAIGVQITSLDDQIAAGQRHLDQFEANLRATFTNLEVLVSSLQSQSAFLLSALGKTSTQ